MKFEDKLKYLKKNSFKLSSNELIGHNDFHGAVGLRPWARARIKRIFYLSSCFHPATLCVNFSINLNFG